jgi:hypothetical protein
VDPGIIDRRVADRGFTSLQFLIASSLALVVFVVLANIVVVQYSRGAMRSALDQGVRAGTIAGSVDACEDRIGQVLGELLGGSIGETTDFECDVVGTLMQATGELTVDSWTPFTGDFYVDLVAEASLEPDGTP